MARPVSGPTFNVAAVEIRGPSARFAVRDAGRREATGRHGSRGIETVSEDFIRISAGEQKVSREADGMGVASPRTP